MKALLALALLAALPGCTGESNAAGDDLPRFSGRVVDNADLLGPATERRIETQLAQLERETSDQFVVVTVSSLRGEKIEELGLRLGNGWGVGQQGLDNGVLLVVAAAERKARIEVGRGLEGLLTDARTERIMATRIVRHCGEGRFERGISGGVDAISSLLRSDRSRPRRLARPQAA